MTRRALAVAMAMGACLLGLTAGGAARADDPPLKVVFHINSDSAEVHEHGLKNIQNVLKEDPKAEVEVVCHSGGITLLEKSKTGQKGMVETLSKAGVKFVACENTMRQRSIRKDDLLPESGTVPSGAVEVIRKQQRGFAYFKP